MSRVVGRLQSVLEAQRSLLLHACMCACVCVCGADTHTRTRVQSSTSRSKSIQFREHYLSRSHTIIVLSICWRSFVVLTHDTGVYYIKSLECRAAIRHDNTQKNPAPPSRHTRTCVHTFCMSSAPNAPVVDVSPQLRHSNRTTYTSSTSGVCAPTHRSYF